MTATQFDALSDEEVDKLKELPKVIARCSPDTKVKMIEALHRRNKYVAMTGDGVNGKKEIFLRLYNISFDEIVTKFYKI